MSYEAMAWAMRQPVKHSPAKFVLVAMANHADDDMVAWPSVASIAEATAQDRKTVIANIARLVDGGYLTDTGMRRGATKQVIVYLLKAPEIGTVKESQNRNSSKTGTVPKFLRNSTNFPHKQSQISPETVLVLGHGTSQEPINNQSGNQSKAREAPVFEIPDWIDGKAWTGYLDMRKRIRKPMTERAVELAIGKLDQFRAKGHDPNAILDNSTMNSWQGLFEPRGQSGGKRDAEGVRNENSSVARAWAGSMT